MAAGLNSAPAFASQEHRQIVVVVTVAIAQSASINNHAVIQQGAFSLSDRLQFVDEVRELSRVKSIDFGDLPLFLVIATMMRKVMMAVSDTDERILPVTAVMSHDEAR